MTPDVLALLQGLNRAAKKTMCYLLKRVKKKLVWPTYSVRPLAYIISI